MTDITTIDTNNFAEMAKAMGMANETILRAFNLGK